jgi:hypothetical protein
VSVDTVAGSGAHSAWNVNLAGDVGSQGLQGIQGNTGNTGNAGTAAPTYGGTSSTSVLIGTGSKTWTLASNSAGYAYAVGTRVRLAYTTSPAANYMEGVVTAYNSGTLALTVTVDNTLGSGTYAAWTASVTGDKGASGSNGSNGSNGANGSNGLSLTLQGTWSSGTAYAVNDAVTLSGASYACTAAHTNQQPPNAAYWMQLAAAGSASLTTTSVQLTDAPTTTSSSYVVVTSTTLTLTTGTYMVHFAGSFNTGSSNVQTMNVALYVNAAVRAHTVLTYDSKLNLGIALVDLVTISGTQTVDVRWKTTSGTLTAGPRTLIALRIA